MPIVKVWNDNQYEHVEKYKGEEIRIKPGQYVEMDYIDAVDFRGQFITPKMLGPNNPDPRFYKMIRVEEPAEPVVKEDRNVFHATGEVFKDKAQLIEFAQAYAKANADLSVKNDDLDKQASGSGIVDQLKAEIAELRELVAAQARSKPGPKPKQKVG